MFRIQLLVAECELKQTVNMSVGTRAHRSFRLNSLQKGKEPERFSAVRLDLLIQMTRVLGGVSLNRRLDRNSFAASPDDTGKTNETSSE